MSLATYSIVAVARTPQQLSAATLVELGPIRGTVRWTEDIVGAGQAMVSVGIEALQTDIRDRLRDLVATPMEVWVYRDSTMVFAGPVVGVEVRDGMVRMTCRDLLYYLAYMRVTADKSWTTTDQATIAKTLVDDWQALDYGDFGIDTSGITTHGVTRTLDIPGLTERPSVLEEVVRLGRASNGYDAYVDPATRDLVLDNPTRGVDRTATVFLERGIASPSVRYAVGAGIVASDVFGIGTNRDLSTALFSTANTAGVRSSFGRTAHVVTLDPVDDQTHLDDFVEKEKDIVAAALFQPSLDGLLPVSAAQYDDFDVGDSVTYSFDVGLGLNTGSYRVVRREVNVDTEGTERMKVEFE